MSEIQIFYHFFACCPQYPLWLDEQLGLLRDSGLGRIARVNLCISSTTDIAAADVLDYVCSSFGDIIGSTRILEKHKDRFHEGATLDEIYRFSDENPDCKILYMHSKGISKVITDQKNSFDREMFPFPSAYRQRQAVQRFCIVEHQKCIESLDVFEVAGPRLRLWPVPFFAGNFWWAKSSYIRTLQPPLSEARFGAEIDWSTVSRQTAQRIAQLRNKLPVYERWGRSANEFWICNNTVHPDGSISMRFPDMDCSAIRNNFSQLYDSL